MRDVDGVVKPSTALDPMDFLPAACVCNNVIVVICKNQNKKNKPATWDRKPSRIQRNLNKKASIR